jgi:hypothetical protein
MLFIFFLPKVNLYYKAEELLENYKITVSAEKLTDSGFNFKINDGVIYFDDLVVAKVEEISITPLLLYNKIDVKPFSFSKDMKQFVPLKINNLNITHTILNPLHVSIKGSGEFGSLDGDISILDRNISLILMPSKTLLNKKPFWLRKMKKDSQGGYRYESAY